MDDDERKIREIESQIIDKHYKGYAFYQYSADIVIPYLLQVYGDIERHRYNLVEKGNTEANISSYISNLTHGIGHCIRWINTQQSPKFNDTSNLSPRQIQEMAVDFLEWGTSYYMIVQEFVTWSRKIKTVKLDEVNKTIIFTNPTSYDYAKIYDKQLLYASRLDATFSEYPHNEMEYDYREWIKEIDFSRPPIANHIVWSRGRRAKSYPSLYNKMKELLFPELPETTNFDGYTLRDLRQFFALFFLNFYFIRWVEDFLDSQSGKNLSFGSNPLYLSKEKFQQLASTITALPVDVCAEIIADLTFNPNNLHTTVTIQPFIISVTGTYYILPNLFCQLDPSRMMLGALNKGEKKSKYDKLINTIEKENLKSLCGSLKNVTDCTCHLEKLIKANGKQIHPDIILVDVERKIVCVIDYKHFIGPITASEVDYKLNELNKGIIQVQKYVEFIGNLSKIGTVSTEQFSIYGIIVTHKILPIPIHKNIEVFILDLTTLFEILDSLEPENKNLLNFLQAIKANENEPPKNTFTDFESEIAVAEWKIRRTQKIKTKNAIA